MMTLLAAARAGEAGRMSADIGWIWIVIAIYFIASAIGAIRRALSEAGRRAAQASGSPAEGRQETAAARQAAQETAATRAARRVRRAAPVAPSVILTAGQTSARSAAQMLDAPPVSVQPAREALAQVLTRMLQAQTEQVGTSAAPPIGVTIPSGMPQRRNLSAPALSALPEPTRLTPAVASASAVELSDLTARLGTPAGLAFAVVAAAIVGPPQALRTEPQEPGGW